MKFLSTFIGLKVEILNSSQFEQIGLIGKVIDESKNTFLISSDDKEKTIIKAQTIFRFDDNFIVDGSTICFRHHERAKKLI